MPDGTNCLQLAIRKQLMKVVDALCQRGANMNLMDASGNCPLWEALESGHEDIASVLVSSIYNIASVLVSSIYNIASVLILK